MRTSLSQKIALVGLGICLFLVLLELALRLCAGVFLFLQEARNLDSIKQKGQYRILCLGESTTALGGKESYPEQLEIALNRYNSGIKFSVINKGVPGTSTAWILEQVEGYLNKYHPDMVVTMMGINDYDHGYNLINIDTGILKKGTFGDSLRIIKAVKFLARRLYAAVSQKTVKDSNSEIILAFEQYYDSQSRENNPKNNKPHTAVVNKYVNLGNVYLSRGNHQEAEAVYRKLIKFEPDNYDFHISLGWILLIEEKFDQANQAELEAITIDPDRDAAYNASGFIYLNQSNYPRAAEMFEKAIAKNPKSHKAYVNLGACYILQGRYQQAQEVYKKAIVEDSSNDRAYGGLAVVYNILGDSQTACEYFKKADKTREAFFSPVTIMSYRRLAEILKKRSVKLLCMQYPMRSILPLKIILNGYPDIVFVDNERIFKQAVEKEGYKNYFSDFFAGDFGHCTLKGNQLIAENAAKVIIKEIFH